MAAADVRAERRRFLAGLAALVFTPNWSRAAAPAESTCLAAAWQAGSGYQVGILQAADELAIRAAIDVPTRAHALLQEPGGTLLAVARRPGDWLLRWDQTGKALAWCWIEPRRAFTGHVVSDGRRLYIAETDLDSGLGLIGVRDVHSLEKLAEWPTQGIDPHQLLWDASHPGALIVANGGVPTQPETGRMKRDLERMDSSLVRIDAQTGECLGQWRLADRRLSLRHLAWNGTHLGITLQAEHAAAADKGGAPVLAVFDGHTLRPVAAPQSLAGYGGDVAATHASAGDGFAVSCPRAQGIALFTTDGVWQGFVPLVEACALAASPDRVWAGGRLQALMLNAATPAALAGVPDVRLDNHWISLHQAGQS